MLRVIPHGDVTELRFSSVRSRLMRYAVSAFVTRDVLIDSGFPDVRSALARWARAVRPVGAIITHGHEDHGGNVPWLVAAGLPVQMAPDTEAVIRDPGRIGWYRRLCWGSPTPLRAPVTPFAHPALTLRPARGHSADHHVVWDAERGTVFGGDLFVGVKVRVAHHDEDLRGQVSALREVASWQPIRFFDGHRGRVEEPAALLKAKADWLEETIAAVEQRVRAGWGDAAIRDAILGREDLTGLVSAGDYSRLNFVRSVRRSMP
jgi:endoribonuclease LACTB2